MILSSMRDVVFGYGKEPVIDQLSLDIHVGEFIGITGPNGSAKTTLLKLLLGLLKPWSGTIHMNPQLKRGNKSNIGYVPQQVASFNSGFPSTVNELVRSGCYTRLGLFRRFTATQDAIVERSLREVGMWEYRNTRVGELSGGQKQRICIARAMAGQPQVLVLDEPTTGMDRHSREGFYNLMRHYVDAHGITIIMVTHGLEEMGDRLDRTITLERQESEEWQCLSTNSCNVPSGQVD
ncbi:metal ABC transporter ATP-binding protein [Paenibacillus sp. FSL K6-1122]|jgi:zinc transport system ATP-binding protein|uniref:metal ABC transporter ATP-binding protein n=1 Tax=Paenibacillus TaxID=44249 RepID=UPI0008912DE3|nr:MULTISPECIES: metal ABC transporter ATP-binding protein [Paenibacillus]MCL6661952.1 metal ABC transporter ATP-binding protein [Paenibacillus amylolyticus]UOK61423.1 metal ABC transporter ATP-binding protein [Paenibacillus sp. OVF10]WJM05950.1 metal ABC transporter ATP-binding protein [Paenibacillus sp. PK1-4R]SDC52484.1 zinc transport system ATP-binding protein [Paenibacillus sp. CF095]